MRSAELRARHFQRRGKQAMLPNNLAESIKSERIRRGMTQYQVSLALGVPSVYVHRWETGMHVPWRIAHIEKVLEFLNAQTEA